MTAFFNAMEKYLQYGEMFAYKYASSVWIHVYL